MSQFSLSIDDDGNLTMAAGVVHCLHGTTTYFPVGGGSFTRGAVSNGDRSTLRKIPAGSSFHGGSGRNFIVSAGPANDALPRGFYKPRVPDEYAGPIGATLTRDPDTGALSLHDGTDELATGSGIGGLTGVPSAGSFPFTEWILTGSYPDVDFYNTPSGGISWELAHDKVTGDAVIKFGLVVMLERLDGSTTDPSGVYTAGPDAETEYNSGSPWTYTIASGGLSGTLTASAYAETEFNDGNPFTLDIEAESGMPAWPNAAVDFAPFAGTAVAGLFNPTGWQSWQSADDPAWSIVIDGSGAGTISDGTDVVATRAADATRLYDPGGTWVATTYGADTFNGGEEWAGKATRTLATPMAGKVYLELTVDVSNEVTSVAGPFFAASLPTNTSTRMIFIIAESDGAGNIRQVWEGPINWAP